MPINALPTPPSRTDPTNFAARGDALMGALPAFVTQANETAAAMNLNSTTDASTSSVLIGTGAKSFTVTSGKSFQPGMWLVIASTAAPSTNAMNGTITSYLGATLTMNIVSVLGSGTFAAWTISQSAPGGTASLVGNTPAGNIAATTVQGALNELDAEKALAAGSTLQEFSVATLNAVLPLHLNDIVNGDFKIAQIGTSFPAPASGAYDLDGWLNSNTSTAVFTVAQVTGSAAGRLARQNTITTADAAVAAGDFVLDSTRMEGSNIEKYVGQTFTVAFRARVPAAGIHCVALRNSGNDRSYVVEINFPTANVYQNCSFTVVGGLPTAGTWNYANGTGLEVSFAHMVGTTFQTTPNAWQAGSFLGTANQVNDCATLSNVWAMEKVTLNLGTVAAVSEIDVGDELRRCQRYFAKTYQQNVVPGATAQGNIGAIATPNPVTNSYPILGTWRFPVVMRTTPTIVIYNPSTGVVNSFLGDATSFSPAATLSVGESGASYMGNNVSVSASVFMSIHSTAAARL